MLVAQNSLGPVCPVPLTVRGRHGLRPVPEAAVVGLPIVPSPISTRLSIFLAVGAENIGAALGFLGYVDTVLGLVVGGAPPGLLVSYRR